MSSTRAARAASVACMLVLQACATLEADRGSRPASPTVFPEVRATFVASGRISVRHGVNALTANFRWRHDGARDEIDIASPLGQTLARLSGGQGAVSLRLADGRVVTAPDWSALSSQSLAWALPVDGLAYWIQGAPRPEAEFAAEAAADGTPALLRQDGWTIVYQPFARDASAMSRPVRMALSYPDVEVRLVVDAWE
jgi:outer membrane lipoprotein LolB